MANHFAKKYFIGTSGWKYSHWDKKFYPEDILKKNWFSYYASSFDTVEINYSFYNWPSEKTLKNWKEKAPAGFGYTMKAPRTITHLKRLRNVKGRIKEFYRLTSFLGRKKACHLFQLPPSFKKTGDNLERLRAFIDVLDARKDNAVEFRHKSWWSEEIYELLDENKVGFVTVSGLGMPKDVVLTGGLMYIRFHGRRYHTKYSDKQLGEFASEMRKADCKKAYAYFNNDYHAYAPENASSLKKIIKAN